MAHAGNAIISNDYVTCYETELQIHKYYFPFGLRKHVAYSEIKSCELRDMRDDIGFWAVKLWGQGLSNIWWHNDWSRYSRKKCIIIDTNHWPKIGLTMDDKEIEQVYKFIQHKMSANDSNVKTSRFSGMEQCNADDDQTSTIKLKI